MSLMYPDKVSITPIDINNELKTATKQDTYFIKAFVEDSNILLTGFNGTVVSAYTRVFIPNRKVIRNGQLVELIVEKGDMLAILKMHGKDLPTSEQVPRPIIQIERKGYRKNRHLQVLL